MIHGLHLYCEKRKGIHYGCPFLMKKIRVFQLGPICFIVHRSFPLAIEEIVDEIDMPFHGSVGGFRVMLPYGLIDRFVLV